MPILLIASAVSLGSCVASAPADAASSVSRPLPDQPGQAQSPGKPSVPKLSAGTAASSAAEPQKAASSPRPIGYEELKAALEAGGSRVLLLDVRTQDEFGSGHIPGAVLAPYDAIASSFMEPDKGRPIVVYCRSGRRSAVAAETLIGMGYTDVSDFGAVGNWMGPLKR